mmetsp:Transcript_25432/g.55317  ORF Transcript_25432/g.55317 Transcript_25432/m.55317 type:complete len:311 (+) Transcript_25432:25-957(+)
MAESFNHAFDFDDLDDEDPVGEEVVAAPPVSPPRKPVPQPRPPVVQAVSAAQLCAERREAEVAEEGCAGGASGGRSLLQGILKDLNIACPDAKDVVSAVFPGAAPATGDLAECPWSLKGDFGVPKAFGLRGVDVATLQRRSNPQAIVPGACWTRPEAPLPGEEEHVVEEEEEDEEGGEDAAPRMNFQIRKEVFHMPSERDDATPQDIIGIWEGEWGCPLARKLKFETARGHIVSKARAARGEGAVVTLQGPAGAVAVERIAEPVGRWLAAKADPVPLHPAVVRLEGPGAILDALTMAFKKRDGSRIPDVS